MGSFCKSILRLSHLPSNGRFSSWTPSLSVLPRLRRDHDHSRKNFGGSSVRFKDDEVPPTLSKYELFSEETAPVILDVEEERQRITPDEKTFDEFQGINLELAARGVFDVHEIVELLEKEKGEKIFVVKVPPEFSYADYMVMVNGRSARHMAAMSEYIRKIYKLKVGGAGHIPRVEGQNSKTWMALDLGNIILHVFSKAGREVYDLETLWSVGKEFDTLSCKQRSSGDLITDYSKILASLSPNT